MGQVWQVQQARSVVKAYSEELETAGKNQNGFGDTACFRSEDMAQPELCLLEGKAGD